MTKYQYFVALIFLLFFIGITGAGDSLAFDNVITVDYDKEMGPVNKRVFGSSFEGYKTSNRYSYGRTDYGTGVWNPKVYKSVPEVIKLARGIGLSVFRFTTGNNYDWKEAIGSERKHYKFGVDEFLKTTEEIGAKAVVTIGYVASDAQDAADFVEYLNAPEDDLYPWSRERASNGHALPYNVEYFEIGNEIYNPKFKVSPEEYAYKYLKYYKAMKAIDASIKIGTVLRPSNIWNRRVMEVIKDKIDFGIIHIYSTPFSTLSDKMTKEMSYSEILKLTQAVPVINNEVEIQDTLKFLRMKTGKDIPLAITEFNIGFSQSKPIPYRHTLGAALVNAELLRIFMKPENNILIANYHHFSNGYWGMVKSQDDFINHDYQKPINYIKRPNYYVYELYHKHFGEVLIESDVKSESYNIDRDKPYMQRMISKINSGKVIGSNVLGEAWKIKELSGIKAEENDGVLRIDFIDPTKFNYFHASKKVKIKPETYYRLSGYIKTEKLIANNGIHLMIMGKRGLLKKSSLAMTEMISGTSDWQYVHVIYKTPKDASTVKIMARRIGEHGPLKGTVFFKDVKLEQFEPDTHIPFLSVSASKSKDGNKVYLMVVNKSVDKAVRSVIDTKDLSLSDNVNVWILNGPTIYSTNEQHEDMVKITHKKVIINSNPFEFIFEPHSLTALEMKKVLN